MAYAVQTRLAELEKENRELRHIIAAHAGQIERNTQALYGLYGGLYNPKEQKHVLNGHLISLFGTSAAAASAVADDEDADSESDDDDEDIWPTTRQGDEHEKWLKKSEERLRCLEEQVVAMEKRQLEKLNEMENKV
jgi:hypothetical protein